jgi:hypothetical protein
MSAENLSSASNTGQNTIADLVQVRLRAMSNLSSVFFDVTSFAVGGDTTISFPRWTNNFSVQKLSGAQKGDDQEALFDLDTLPLSEEAHIQWAIKKFDQARAKVQILQQAIAEATTAHSNQLNDDIYAELVSDIHATNKLAGSLDQAKVVDMITQANIIRMPKTDRTFLFGNSAYGTLLKIDGFVDASKSNLEIVRTGQIGTLYGIPVVEDDSVAAGVSLLVHRQALAYGFGALPAIEDQKAIEYGTGSRRWVLDQMYGLKSLNSGKLVVSVGIA